MSIEMHVLFAGKLPSKAKLARKMKELAFPFSIMPPLGSLETQEGYMPMRFRADETGIEFDVFEEREDLAEIAGADLAQKFERSANFRWGGDETEMLCGMCACAALATLVDGLVLEESGDGPLSPEQAVERARTTLASAAPPETTRKRDPGTRPADIRRYVKPLLKVRDDLVLIDRRLVIRPVRHLLRGVVFDRAGDPSVFYLNRTIKPLYASSGSWFGVGIRFGATGWRVYEPYFQALLEAQLAQAFEHIGKVTTLSEFGAYLEADWDGGHDDAETRVATMLLCGERERAAQYLEQLKEHRERSSESDYLRMRELKASGGASDSYDLVMRELERVRREGDPYYLKMRELLDSFSRDAATFCAQRHAEEASSVKELKLEAIWEPSPFPIELPVAERRQSAEAFFSTTPWIMQRPSPLADLPAVPGEVRFAIDVGRREGSLILIAPLTRQEAEDRHQRFEKYVLAVRLGSGLEFVLKRAPCGDPNDPSMRRYLDTLSEDQRHRIKLWIALQSGSRLAETSAYPWDGRVAVFKLSSVNVSDRKTKSWWGRDLLLPGDRLFPGDGVAVKNTPASAERGYFVPTAAQRDLVSFPPPAFGEYADLAEYLQAALRLTGYGELR